MKELLPTTECAIRLEITPAAFRKKLLTYPLEPEKRYTGVNLYDWRQVERWAATHGIGIYRKDGQ